MPVYSIVLYSSRKIYCLGTHVGAYTELLLALAYVIMYSVSSGACDQMNVGTPTDALARW